MDQSTILLEYLKEQYAQARQHENRQSTATGLLVAASGVVLGLTVKDGALQTDRWWLGVVIFSLGLANAWINDAHYRGNRFHVKLAGKTRRALEKSCAVWTVPTPTELRIEALDESKLNGPDVSIGEIVHQRMQVVPAFIMAIGLLIALHGLLEYKL